MAEPFDTWAEDLLAAIGDGDAAAVAAILSAMSPDELTQLQQSMTLLARYDGLLFTSGAPSDVLGAPGAVAIDVVAKVFYGPKDETTGWPDGEAFLQGPDGEPGADGKDGREVQLQASGTHIQWRYVGEGSWTNLVTLASLKGDQGDAGTNGTNGTNGSDGDDGADGADGLEVELRVSGGNIQWRLTGGSWADLIAVADLKGDQGDQGEPGVDGDDGDDGREPEFFKSATHLQWRLVGDPTWLDLVALADLKGEPGDDGADGEGAGDVVGPASAVDNQLAVFDGTTGKLLKAVTAAKSVVGLGNVDNTSDVNKPVSTAQQTALDGKADLVGGKVPTSQMPSLAISDVSEVADQTAMLALTAEPGDVAIRTDENKTYMLAASPASTLANWKLLRTPTDLVSAVAGLTGAISAADLKTALGLGALALLATVGTSQIDNDAVTFAKAQNIATARIVGRVTASPGDMEELTAAQVKTLLALTAADVGAGTFAGVVKLLGLTESAGTVSTGALTVSDGTVFRPSWSSNTTVSLSGLPGSPSTGDTVTATIIATITGSPVLTWPSGTKWIGGSAPTVAAGRLIVTLIASYTGSAWEYFASGGMAS